MSNGEDSMPPSKLEKRDSNLNTNKHISSSEQYQIELGLKTKEN